jgi:hypothetical protein
MAYLIARTDRTSERAAAQPSITNPRAQSSRAAFEALSP